MRITIVGEAYGEVEEQLQMPFVGPSGYLLNTLLQDAGIEKTECYLTNVFNLRPKPTNAIENLCAPKREVNHSLPPLGSGKYIRDEYLGELDRLYSELIEQRPNLIIALGATAAWATLGATGISGCRGSIASALPQAGGFKVLPTYHPAALMREPALRAITIADLIKAERESHFPEIRRPYREIWIDPTLDDMERFNNDYIAGAEFLSVDIETRGKYITCLGFAPSPSVGLVVPFEDPRQPNNVYWPTHQSEREAWFFVRRVLRGPQRKIFQNGLYDLRFLWERYGLTVANAGEDTMLMHHALQPELPKSLSFLGSIYTNESSWKLMRDKWTATIKKED